MESSRGLLVNFKDDTRLKELVAGRNNEIGIDYLKAGAEKQPRSFRVAGPTGRHRCVAGRGGSGARYDSGRGNFGKLGRRENFDGASLVLHR